MYVHRENNNPCIDVVHIRWKSQPKYVQFEKIWNLHWPHSLNQLIFNSPDSLIQLFFGMGMMAKSGCFNQSKQNYSIKFNHKSSVNWTTILFLLSKATITILFTEFTRYIRTSTSGKCMPKSEIQTIYSGSNIQFNNSFRFQLYLLTLWWRHLKERSRKVSIKDICVKLYARLT